MKNKTYDKVVHRNPIIRNVQKKLYKANNNWLAAITGDTGSGKSWSALSIASKVDPTFDVDKVVLEPLEFMENLTEDQWGQGDCIVFDEAGAGMSAKEHMTKKNRIIDQVLQTFRRQNVAVIFTVPSKANVDKSVRRLLDTTIETVTIDYANNVNVLKWLELDYNQRNDKIYYHYPKKRLENGGTTKIKRLRLSKPEDDLIERYERKRDKYQQRKNKEFYEELKEKMEKGSGSSGRSYNHECKRCGYEWDGFKEDPKECPECGSRRWDKSREEDIQDASVVKSS